MYQEDEAQYGRDEQERSEAFHTEQRIHAFRTTLNEMLDAEARLDGELRESIHRCLKALDALEIYR